MTNDEGVQTSDDVAPAPGSMQQTPEQGSHVTIDRLWLGVSYERPPGAHWLGHEPMHQRFKNIGYLGLYDGRLHLN